MADWAKRFSWAFVPSFLASLLLEFLIASSLVTLQWSELRATGIGALTLSIVRIPVLTLALAVPSYFVVSYTASLTKRIFHRRRSIHEKNQPAVYVSSRGKPDTVIWAGSVEKYGVVWPVGFGYKSGVAGTRRGSSYVYVDNPRCPQCLTETLRRTLPKWGILEKKVWRCPDCETVVNRPRSARYEEKDAVENIIDKGLSIAINESKNSTVSDPFEDRDDVMTEQWNPGRI
jgi:ribosomal protein L37AE/L43A